MDESGYDALVQSLAAGRSKVEPLSLDGVGPSSGGRPADLEGHAICIDYEDSNGDSSRRWISVHRVVVGSAPYIEGYCWKRKQSRTFRVDRIEAISDMNGEILDAQDFLAAYGFSKKRKRGSRKASAEPDEPFYAARPSKRKKPSDELPEWKKHLNDHLEDDRQDDGPTRQWVNHFPGPEWEGKLYSRQTKAKPTKREEPTKAQTAMGCLLLLAAIGAIILAVFR